MFSAAWNERQDRAGENATLFANTIGELDKQGETLLSRLMEADTSTVGKANSRTSNISNSGARLLPPMPSQ